MQEVIIPLIVSVQTIHASVVHVLGDIGIRAKSSAPPTPEQHLDHYLTSDGEHYRLSNGLYYRVNSNS